MGADSLKMSYDDMQAEITKLEQYAQDFETATTNMSTSVGVLCDNWTSASTEAYRTDYTALTKNFSDTLGVVRDLIKSTQSYIADMQAVDEAYSKTKVSVK